MRTCSAKSMAKNVVNLFLTFILQTRGYVQTKCIKFYVSYCVLKSHGALQWA